MPYKAKIDDPGSNFLFFFFWVMRVWLAISIPEKIAFDMITGPKNLFIFVLVMVQFYRQQHLYGFYL